VRVWQAPVNEYRNHQSKLSIIEDTSPKNDLIENKGMVRIKQMEYILLSKQQSNLG
jgi:hypothetical protein